MEAARRAAWISRVGPAAWITAWTSGWCESDLPSHVVSCFLSGAWAGAACFGPTVNLPFICDFWAESLLHPLGMTSFVPFRQMSLSVLPLGWRWQPALGGLCLSLDGSSHPSLFIIAFQSNNLLAHFYLAWFLYLLSAL